MSASVHGPERKPLDVVHVPLSGVHLIEASAGTGKTYTITSLVLRLLVEREIPIESILAVTFTNAATAELKDRVLARIEQARDALARERGEAKVETSEVESRISDAVVDHLAGLADRKRVRRLLDRASRDADRAAIFTIHGFAARLLRDHAFESGSREDTELIGDQRALVQDVVTDFWTSRIATLPRGTFEQIGGTSFYRQLTRVGLAAAAAWDVPLVPVERTHDIADEEANIAGIFERARAAFAESGDEVLYLLSNSTSINRAILKVPSLEADFLTYRAYFARGQPTLGHPEKDRSGKPSDRWTQNKVSASIKKNKPQVEHPLLAILGELHDAFERCRIAARQYADELRAELCRLVHVRVQQEHVSAGTQSFDGLLTDLNQALRDPERGRILASEVRQQFPVALIDEFQDTDPVQYEIFRRLYVPEENGVSDAQPEGATSLYLIGDPKQSIYAFRGADVQTYLQAARHASGGIWTLDTSYRASPRLVTAQNALFSSPRDAFCVPGIAYHPVSARPGAEDVLIDAQGKPLEGIRLISCESAEESAWLRVTAGEVARFLSLGHTLQGRTVSPSNLAVLTRTNRQAQDVQAELRKLGIPAVMHGDRSVFESPEALELRRVLRALAEPGHRQLARTALCTRMLGLDANALLALDEDHDELEKWTARLRTWGQLWQTRGVAHAVEALSAETDLLRRTLADRDGERRMTNLRHLLELLHESQTKEHLGVAGLLRYFDGAISDPMGHAMAAEARQLRLESDADAVTLTTAHKSKGLEYDIVFLPALGLDDKRFSDEAFRYFDDELGGSRFEMRHKDSRDESEEIHQLEQRQESLRLAYVALTRAKHHAVALCGPGRGFSSLHYLLHERNSGDPGGIEALALRLKKLVDGVRHEEIRALCSIAPSALSWSEVEEGKAPTFSRAHVETELVAPSARPSLVESEKTSSFSAMTRDSHHSLSRAAREGRDVDEVGELEARLGSATDPARPDLARSTLSEFPRGARPGDALHAVLEHAPFAEGSPEDRGRVVERELLRRGFSEVDRLAATQGLEEILATSFASSGPLAEFCLLQLDPERRSAEMEFSLPVAGDGGRFSATKLARALGAEERPPAAPPLESSATRFLEGEVLSQHYLQRVAALPFAAWSGFLRGFIDLVFYHGDRIYGLDYKSNHLGPNFVDYGSAALQECMEEHHYLLQALFYAVAIHRYAKTRIVGYSYDTHFGGMVYVFLRGMHPERPANGVYFYRPEESLVERLSATLGGLS